MADEDFGPRITAAYATEGPSLELGRGMLGGTTRTDAVVNIPVAMMNRHGLIAGATGTGKTKTLQLLAEQLSGLGVAVFAADVKGDLSGITNPGAEAARTMERVEELGIEWTPAGHPVSFLSLGGNGPGGARSSLTARGRRSSTATPASTSVRFSRLGQRRRSRARRSC